LTITQNEQEPVDDQQETTDNSPPLLKDPDNSETEKTLGTEGEDLSESPGKFPSEPSYSRESPSVRPSVILSPSSGSLAIPQIDQDLENQPALERSAEVLRYTVRTVEHSISPDGTLRRWLKLNLRVLLWVGVPILLFVPLLGYLFGGLVGISQSINMVLSNLVQSLKPMAILMVILLVILLIVRR